MVQDELYTRDNRQKYQHIQKQLNTIWDEYSAGNISTEDMLKKTAVMYGDL